MGSPGVIFWNSNIFTQDLFLAIPNVVNFFSEQYFLHQTHQIGSPRVFLEIQTFWPQDQFVLAIPNVVELWSEKFFPHQTHQNGVTWGHF